jgi:predicted HTH transcriptional regulator
MEPFPDVRDMKIFPCMESHTMEFKLSLSNIIKSRLTQTICSFLNAKGGYIVFGVEDHERRIVGLNATSKELDGEIRWFDNFYHNKRITDWKGNPLAPGTISADIVNVTSDKCILVVTIKPRPGETYKCNDGTAWHRLSASVYGFNEGSAEKQILELGDQVRHEQNKRRNAEKELESVRREMKELISLAKSIDERLENFSKAVDMNILEQKSNVEEMMKKQKGFCSYLFGFLN